MSDVVLYKDDLVVITPAMIVTKDNSHALSAISGLALTYTADALIMVIALPFITFFLAFASYVHDLGPVDLFAAIFAAFGWLWILRPSNKWKLMANLTAGGSARLLNSITSLQGQAILYAFSHAKAQSR